jgi:N-acyl-D-aspartate/D-glutamate deacylase
VVFDPGVIADRATVVDPGRTSIGIDWVLVDGQVALAEGEARRDVRAGRALRSAVAGG